MNEPTTPASEPAPAPSLLVTGKTGDRLINRYAASAPPTIPQPQQHRLPYDKIGITEPSPSTRPPSNAGCNFEGLSVIFSQVPPNLGLLEQSSFINDSVLPLKPDNSIRTAFDMHSIDKANSFCALGCHDYRGCADAGTKKPHTAKDCAISHPGGGKDDFLTGREISGIIDPTRIAYAHLFHPVDGVFRNPIAVFSILKLLLQNEAGKYLTVQTFHRCGGEHAFRRAASTHYCVYARTGYRCGNSG